LKEVLWERVKFSMNACRFGGTPVCGGCDTVDLLKIRIPILSCREDVDNIRRFKSLSRQLARKEVTIMPAIKANVTLYLRFSLRKARWTYSPGEMVAALESGADPEVISVNGGGKDEEHIRNAIKAGCRITLDDVDELDLVEKVANELNMKAKIRFRVRPDFPNLWRPTAFTLELVPIDLGTQAYKRNSHRHVIELGRRALRFERKRRFPLIPAVITYLWYWQGMIVYVKLCKGRMGRL
jgi:hypothetical protein